MERKETDKKQSEKKEEPSKEEKEGESEGTGFPQDVDFKKFLGCGG